MKTFVALLALSAVAVAEPQFGFSPYHHGAAQGFLPYGRAAGFGYPAGQQYPLSYPYNFGGQYRHQAQLPYSYLPFQQQQQAAEPMKTPASTEPLKLVTYASSGAVVPEDTPAVMAAKEAHFSLVKSAEQLQQRVFNPYFYQPQQQQRVFKREADAQQQFVSPYTAGYAYQQPQPFQYHPYGAPWARHSYNPYFYQPRFPVGYTAAQSAAALYPQQYQQQPFYFPYQQQQQFVTVKADDGSSKIVKRSAEPQQQFAAPLAYNGYYPAQQYQTTFPAAAHAQLPYAPRAYGYPLGYGQYRTPFFGQRAFQPYGFPFAANRFA